ncbi:phthiocerol/phenolphthiocerol synthesis type-I polyketide synthase D [Kutzneria buriramensis]|uniref:Phthiocerol/phenolphthiocerol synthesis type-I polyketide synthase D n=1 Tax=Kutzneria buriramensis TaxID=1045776 RepID=A0A3E0GTX0_9PSEU|nr:phthiocerol/phenolphthiocerol synthesis type-I polyketide synthase D [Kutzneria buriramensis]
MQRWLIERLAAHVGVPPDRIDTDRPFADYGISSRDAVGIAGELEDLLDRPIEPIALWRQPTIRKLADSLSSAHAPPKTGTARAESAVAVIGIGCRLPGGVDSPAELWRLLMAGDDVVTAVPTDRWEAYPVPDGTSTAGGFLTRVYDFDAEFFGISPREAVEMDPQQRILLEVVWEALEHAGIPPDSLAGSRTGVFVGAATNDHGRERLADLADISGWTGTGAAASVLANRVSYVLDLRGPSLTVDTACSSSLVALHLAKRSLDSRECDLAIVAGVNLILSPAVTVNFDRSGALAPGGRCRPFDAAADGYVRSEGCAAVVLTRPEGSDGPHATVVASAVNQDGRSNGLMAPNPSAQQELLAEVYWGIPREKVCYVEAHGTGTPLGDPIEATALGSVLGEDRARPLLIGSIKSNLGHLEAAAGIAGLIKAVLSLDHGHIPPTLHYHSPNPHIDLDRLGLAVAAKPSPLPAGGGALIGVSSFGFGGANAHAVLRQP